MRSTERATPRIVERTVTEAEIRPKLRFLLSAEAREEGEQMARNLGCYTLSRPADETRSQFSSLVRGIREGRFPHIAAADELMDGVLSESLQKIADGFRQPEWMLWYQSWANALAKGRPDNMEWTARRMMTRDPRYLPSMIDDETAMLPTTTVDAVYAGGGVSRRSLSSKTVAPDDHRAKPQLDPAAVDAARAWYRDTYLQREFRDSLERRKAIAAFTPEQKVAHKEHCSAAAKLKEYAHSVIDELQKLTKEKFDRAWKTKDELHAALREHFRACGYEEELDFRWLRLGGYN